MLVALLPFVVYALGLRARWRSIVAALVVLLGAGAAFDAWAAAMVRGRPREAWARAGLLVVLFGGFALIALVEC